MMRASEIETIKKVLPRGRELSALGCDNAVGAEQLPAGVIGWIGAKKIALGEIAVRCIDTFVIAEGHCFDAQLLNELIRMIRIGMKGGKEDERIVIETAKQHGLCFKEAKSRGPFGFDTLEAQETQVCALLALFKLTLKKQLPCLKVIGCGVRRPGIVKREQQQERNRGDDRRHREPGAASRWRRIGS